MNQRWFGRIARSFALTFLTRVVCMALSPMHSKFDQYLRNPEKAQDKALNKILKDISNTEYGRNYGISIADLYKEFANKLPIATYEVLSPWVERQIKTAGNVLVNEKVPFYEKTSGSSGPFKLIPYTKSHLSSFHHMFLLWFYDLLKHGPKFYTGKIFASISPFLFVQDASTDNLKIGLEKDEEYLPVWIQMLFQSFWVLPGHIAKLCSAENFKRIASLYLISEEDLETVLIWSPSYFTNLIDYMERHSDLLIQDLSKGRIVLEGLEFRFKKLSKDRLSILKKKPISWAEFWPALKLISCWDNALANSGAHFLRETFPQTLVQGKGLLATEGPMTLPLISSGGFVPLLDMIFFEFVDESGQILRLHELSKGKEYEIIISIPGGFTRYRIGDVIRVTHFYRETPCFEFIGRAGIMSDLVGEKLTEPFVKKVIQELTLAGSRFQILAPVTHEKRPYYRLLVDHLPEDMKICADKLDDLLQESHRYRSARLLGQLEKAEVVVNPKAEEMYLDYFSNAGMKRGNIKHRYLFNKPMDALMKIENHANHI